MEHLPQDRAACLARIAETRDAIAAIKTQIATADLERQAGARRLDPRWFHRAKTALRHRQLELDHLTARLGQLPSPRDTQRETLLEVLREHVGDEVWQSALDEARRRSVGAEGL